MTPAEKILWQELRGNKLGVHFRRQQVIAGFIVEFYCHNAGLVVEVDGDIHDLQQEEDARRERVLSEVGLRVVRFRALGMKRRRGICPQFWVNSVSLLRDRFGNCPFGVGKVG